MSRHQEPTPRWVPFVVIGAVSAAILAILQPHLILAANTPSGGDMGAHVLGPAVLRDTLLPSGNVLGWSDAWFAGYPAFYFYFPLPSLVIVLLDVVLPYGVAFKIVTVCGLVATAPAAYYLARAMNLSRSVAIVAGAAGGSFVLIESFTIYGANVASTLAGEFSFSWSFALGLVYLGLLIRTVRDGRPYLPAAAAVLGLTALSHIIPTIMFVLASLGVVVWKGGALRTVATWAWGFAVSAFWALPLLLRIGFSADMAWRPLGAWDEIMPTEMWLVALLATGGLGWLVRRSERAAPLLILTFAPVVYYWLPSLAERFGIFAGTWKLWNGRLLPFWFFGLTFMAGVAVGTAGAYLARRLPTRLPVWAAGAGVLALGGVVAAFAGGYRNARWWALGLAITGAVLVASRIVARVQALTGPLLATTGAALFLVASLAGLGFLPGWARWNYSGYEGKSGWNEYQALMETIERLPAGRVQWEANSDLDRYGTPMALMLTPYWSEAHPSMEGLFFESSLTTPFHFLNAAELSHRPSNPIPGLRYHTFQFDRGIDHMAVYGVRYYVAFTEEATAAARNNPRLTEIAASEPFTVFEFPESPLVEVASRAPVVFETGAPLAAEEDDDTLFGSSRNFGDVALDWYDDLSLLDAWIVESGPDDWPRIDSLDDLDAAATPLGTSGEATDVVIDDGRISFETDAVGVPHLVKVSYFPNWEADGADGPYRAAPSLMVVVPTSEQVTLNFARQWPEQVGWYLTLAGMLGVAAALATTLVRRIRTPVAR